MNAPQISKVSTRQVTGVVLAIVLGVMVIVGLLKSFEDIGPNDILVVQSPWEGKLTWHVTPGVKWQGLGSVEIYKKRAMYTFDAPMEEEIVLKGLEGKPDVKVKRKTCSDGIAVQFNEGGHGKMCGSIQFEMPLDVTNLNKIHTKFGSQAAVQRNIVETMMGKAVYLSGPLMSSRESYAEKRNDLIFHVEDQVQNGVYKTSQKEVRTKDQISQQEKSVTIVEIVKGKDGKAERQEESVLNDFGIKAFAFAINKLPYDAAVEQQIVQQQQIAMDVQTSVADARKAEQRTLTVTEQGKANAAMAKWEQEKINFKEIAEAEKNKQVATLNALTAEQYKKQQILQGEGDAAKKRLVMEADGGLELKARTIVEVAKVQAEMLRGTKFVPDIVFGGGNSNVNAATNLTEFMSVLAADAARRLGTDLRVGGTEKTSGQGVNAPSAQPVGDPKGR